MGGQIRGGAIYNVIEFYDLHFILKCQYGAVTVVQFQFQYCSDKAQFRIGLLLSIQCSAGTTPRQTVLSI
jgi:hypothetical protein